jgi:Glycosyltransferase
MHKNQESCVSVFIIPNHRLEGAQNFFRRLHEEIQLEQKHLFIEEGNNLLQNLIKLTSLNKKKKLNIFTTVNSNKLGLIFKILHPSVNLFMRLGNTISLEIKKNSIKYFYHKLFYFISIRKCSKFIFQSKVMKNDFLNFFEFKNNQKFLVIHNGIPGSIKIEKSKYSIQNNKVNYLLVGTFKKQKGYDIFLDSLENLSNNIKNSVHFHVCGSGNDFRNFKKELVLKKLDSIVSLYGHVSPNFFYSKCDVYILPSRFEGFSNSLVEALSFGMPAIVSDCPSANREVIVEN